jgi:hypothetical protein
MTALMAMGGGVAILARKIIINTTNIAGRHLEK